MAQLVERLVRNEEASGSNPLISTKKSRSSERDFFIHCGSNGISSDFVLHIIRLAELSSSRRVYHQP